MQAVLSSIFPDPQEQHDDGGRTGKKPKPYVGSFHAENCVPGTIVYIRVHSPVLCAQAGSVTAPSTTSTDHNRYHSLAIHCRRDKNTALDCTTNDLT
eukprot:8522858-Pyramimonas_sp.AAC.1